MRKTRARRAPAPAPSDSSDSDPAEEGIFGPNVSKSPPRAPLQRTELPAAPAAAASSSRMEPDTELQAFLDLRDQTDHNTEVRDRQTDRQTDRPQHRGERQTDRQTDRQTTTQR